MNTATEIAMLHREAELRISVVRQRFEKYIGGNISHWMNHILIEVTAEAILAEAQRAFIEIRYDLAWMQLRHKTKMIQLRGKYGLPLFYN